MRSVRIFKAFLLVICPIPVIADEQFACKTVEFQTYKNAPAYFIEFNRDRLFMITVRSDEIRVKDPTEEIYKIFERRDGKIFAHSYWGMEDGNITTSYKTLLFDTVNANGVITLNHLQKPGANNWVLDCIH